MGLFTLQYIKAMLVCTLVFEAKRNLLLESNFSDSNTEYWKQKVQNTTRFVKYRIFFGAMQENCMYPLRKEETQQMASLLSYY
jgi:hypothetical protein